MPLLIRSLGLPCSTFQSVHAICTVGGDDRSGPALAGALELVLCPNASPAGAGKESSIQFVQRFQPRDTQSAVG